jgi:hypothetical protein
MTLLDCARAIRGIMPAARAAALTLSNERRLKSLNMAVSRQ